MAPRQPEHARISRDCHSLFMAAWQLNALGLGSLLGIGEPLNAHRAA